MNDYYWTRRLLIDALMRAAPIPPIECPNCGWPKGGSGEYECLCWGWDLKQRKNPALRFGKNNPGSGVQRKPCAPLRGI